MPDLKYTTITVASCDPDYLETAYGHCTDIAASLITGGHAVSARFGQILTGDHIGCIIFFSTYPSLDAMGAGWDQVSQSDAFKAMGGSGKARLLLRNVLKLEDVFLTEPPAMEPTVGVVTRFSSPTPYVDEMKSLLPIFAANGALITRYGTLMTGSATGQRLMAVAYPSMEAVEAAYDALAESDAYINAVSDAEVSFRNIFRFAP